MTVLMIVNIELFQLYLTIQVKLRHAQKLKLRFLFNMVDEPHYYKS